MDSRYIIILLCILILNIRFTAQITVDVTTSGAVGDGKSDDTAAFAKAWESACKDKASNSKMVVPGDKTFLVMPMEFMGPCSSSPMTVEVSGKIIAPTKDQFKGKDTWIAFRDVDGLAISGTGEFSGSATSADWWSSEGGNRPRTFQLAGCTNAHIDGLTFTQPPMNHIAITSSKSITITNIKIIAPENSPNTDGIDISNSNTITIQHSNIQTGDDCIAINDGSSYVNITNVDCGPGHGISIGSLGSSPGVMESVNHVNVKDCTFTKTMNGARIKTLNGGTGSASAIKFEGIVLNDVQNPIIIDQNYCPSKSCGAGQASKVKLSDISFEGFTGSTTSTVAVNLQCSTSTPCEGITLNQINIKASSGSTTSSCSNAFGTSDSSNVPPITCLQ